MGIVLHPTNWSQSHLSEEVLEEYVFDRLPETLAAPVEEHLLICQICQNAIAETDEFVAAMKVVASQPAPQPAPWRSVLPSLANRTRLAPITALVILALVMVWKHPQASTPVAVSLSSLRGLNPMAPAPVGKPLQLNIDLPDLVSAGEYRVEVVNAAGSPVWKGAASNINGKLVATISRPLGKGVYWVRLYGGDSELLREFGMSAK
jgi:hypothetical protein